jgi:hypothetical protein
MVAGDAAGLNNGAGHRLGSHVEQPTRALIGE